MHVRKASSWVRALITHLPVRFNIIWISLIRHCKRKYVESKSQSCGVGITLDELIHIQHPVDDRVKKELIGM